MAWPGVRGAAGCSSGRLTREQGGCGGVRWGGPGRGAGDWTGEEGRACGRRGMTLAQLQKQRWAAPPRNRPDTARSAQPAGLSLRGPRSRDVGRRRARAGPGQGYRRAPEHCRADRSPAYAPPWRSLPHTPPSWEARPATSREPQPVTRPPGPRPFCHTAGLAPPTSLRGPGRPRPAALPEKQPLGFLPLAGTWPHSARLPWRRLLRR